MVFSAKVITCTNIWIFLAKHKARVSFFVVISLPPMPAYCWNTIIRNCGIILRCSGSTQTSNLMKKTWSYVFSWKFRKFLETNFLQSASEQQPLLLVPHIYKQTQLLKTTKRKFLLWVLSHSLTSIESLDTDFKHIM